jgi:putative endonuclease
LPKRFAAFARSGVGLVYFFEGAAMSARRLLSRLLSLVRPRPVSLGRKGELAAAKFLRKQGYHIIERGGRRAAGELDLVAVDGRTIVFVEVKTRSSHDAGHPAESITPQKQMRVTRAARAFIKFHGLDKVDERHYRFDVVAVTWPGGNSKPTIEHYQHAFEAHG